MDIFTQTEIVLREAGYSTWAWTGTKMPVVCFEDDLLLGFVHVFSDANELLTEWRAAQDLSLARHAASLRSGGRKAWNVCCVFLTDGQASDDLARAVARIEEDFGMTRKIARIDVRSPKELRRVLLPLLGLQNSPTLGAADVRERILSKSKELPAVFLEAFMGSASANDVAEILLAVS